MERLSLCSQRILKDAPERLREGGRLRVLAKAACVFTVALAVACGPPNRATAADQLTAAMRAVPGVTSVDRNYYNGFDQGAGFRLSVTVGCSVSAQALSDAARAFVNRVDTIGFAKHKVELAFSLDSPSYTTAAPPGESDYSYSRAEFPINDESGHRTSTSSDDVAADVSLWVSVFQFPGVVSVTLGRWGGQPPADRKGRDVWFRATVVDQAAGTALQQRFPQLTDNWKVPLLHVAAACTPAG